MASYNKHEYRRASHEKFGAASDAFLSGHYAVSHYLAGVSVECMLRAFRWAIDPRFDAKHDLKELTKKSGVLIRLPAAKQAGVRDALNAMAVRWSVSHRYAPEDRLETYLKLILPNEGKSKILKTNANDMLEWNQLILTECDPRCP